MVASRFSPVGSIVALTIFVSGIAVWKTNTKNDKPEIITLKPKRKKPRRLRRFADFASVEFNGQRFMTPQDFVDSMIHQNPRPRIKNKVDIQSFSRCDFTSFLRSVTDFDGSQSQ